MKKIITPLALLILAACNNSDKPTDSVEQADSINKAKIDSTTMNTAAPKIQADKATAEFLVEAANGGMAEVQLGNLAQQAAASQAVKDFGKMMVQDHSKANDVVKALAMQRDVTLPDSVGGDAAKMIADLKDKKGSDFDKAYVKGMIKDHEEDIKVFKDAADKVNDAEVKTFINNTIPTLEHHLDSIKAIRKMMK